MIYGGETTNFIANKVSVTDFVKKLLAELFEIDKKLIIDFYPNKNLICISKNDIIIEQIDLRFVVPFNVILSNIRRKLNKDVPEGIDKGFIHGQKIE